MPLEGAFDKALEDVQKVLETMGKKNTDFDLPEPSDFDQEVQCCKYYKALQINSN